MPPLDSERQMTARQGKVLVCITEDWFAVSHFLPLLETLVGMGHDVAVVTRVRKKGGEIERTGARLIPFDWRRGAIRPATDTITAGRLAAVLRAERPDAIHAIALKPIALTTLAAVACPRAALAIHLTGVGYAGTTRTGLAAAAYHGVLRLVANRLRGRGTHLFVENPDDVAALRKYASFPDDRVTILGGAGVDPVRYPMLPPPNGARVRAGFIGRLVWSKGVDVLVDAKALLAQRGERLELAIGGTPDPENPRSVSEADLAAWSADPDIRLAGLVSDIPAFWRDCDFAVVPSRGGEGLPRALLEAACCGRPIVASDVPGCRYFVRNGVEGLLVPPDDPVALADALGHLISDQAARTRMGLAARQRVLGGFTEAHLRAAIRDSYGRLLHRPAR